MNARYLLRQFKNTANYLRLLFDPDLYSLCKSYPRNLVRDLIAKSYYRKDYFLPACARNNEYEYGVYNYKNIISNFHQFQFPCNVYIYKKEKKYRGSIYRSTVINQL